MKHQGKTITVSNLAKFLEPFGYTKSKLANSGHVVLYNQKYGSKIVLPAVGVTKHLDITTLSLVRRNILGKGVLREEELDRFLSI